MRFPSALLRRGWRRLLLVVGLAFVGAIILFAARRPILAGLAGAWIVNETPTRAGAIILLSGGGLPRAHEAARLYRSRLAATILLTHGGSPPPLLVGYLPSERDLLTFLMRHDGVPEDAVVTLEGRVTSTWDEALLIQRWVLETRARNIIVVADQFHTRRIRWLFRKVLRHSGTSVQVVAAGHHKYDASNWWEEEEGLIQFQNEVVKYLYYRCRY